MHRLKFIARNLKRTTATKGEFVLSAKIVERYHPRKINPVQRNCISVLSKLFLYLRAVFRLCFANAETKGELANN